MDYREIDWDKIRGKDVTVYFHKQPGQKKGDRLTGKLRQLHKGVARNIVEFDVELFSTSVTLAWKDIKKIVIRS